MFGSPYREFEEDPFFGPFRDRHEHMSRMMRDLGSFGFRDPFNQHFAIEGARDYDRHERDDRQRNRHQRDDYRDNRELAPTDMFQSMFSGMASMMNQMERNFGRMANDPNSYSYHQSSVMSYSKEGEGQPKYYQATTSTTRAPDGVKETKRAVRDSETGIHKMAVGHHIGDRGYVMERSMDKKTGREERHENFLNLDENEKSSFEKEWHDKTAVKSGRVINDYKPGRYVGNERPRHTKPRQKRLALPETPAGQHRDRHATRRDPDIVRRRELLKTRAAARPTNKHAPKEDL